MNVYIYMYIRHCPGHPQDICFMNKQQVLKLKIKINIV